MKFNFKCRTNCFGSHAAASSQLFHPYNLEWSEIRRLTEDEELVGLVAASDEKVRSKLLYNDGSASADWRMLAVGAIEDKHHVTPISTKFVKVRDTLLARSSEIGSELWQAAFKERHDFALRDMLRDPHLPNTAAELTGEMFMQCAINAEERGDLGAAAALFEHAATHFEEEVNLQRESTEAAYDTYEYGSHARFLLGLEKSLMGAKGEAARTRTATKEVKPSLTDAEIASMIAEAAEAKEKLLEINAKHEAELAALKERAGKEEEGYVRVVLRPEQPGQPERVVSPLALTSVYD